VLRNKGINKRVSFLISVSSPNLRKSFTNHQNVYVGPTLAWNFKADLGDAEELPYKQVVVSCGQFF